MNSVFKKLKKNIINAGPLLLLYYLSFSEIDTYFSSFFEILSFNLQLIIIYYWTLKDHSILGYGHIFLAGIINDLVMGLPMGLSTLLYLTTAFVASYVKNVTVNISLFSDWFTFLIAVFFTQLVFVILTSNFSNIDFFYIDLFYNSFFTLLLYPFFWIIFNIYKSIMIINHNE
jgi:cell shape-determining protein MreD|tara:strand:- start:1051 stop:1569 length:519 start_codon:yes stop_codon:yes gene_type:complete